jgi:hypothetical protein
VSVVGPDLRVRERVENLSDDPVEYAWVHHPAFGSPFIDEHARLEVSARLMVTDALAPGTLLPADEVLPFP